MAQPIITTTSLEAEGIYLLPATSPDFLQALDSGESARRHANMRAALYASADSVVVSVEAIMFDNGGAMGPDHGGAVPRLQAQLDAERDLADQILASPSGSARGILAVTRDGAYSHITDGAAKTALPSRGWHITLRDIASPI